jgi:hypothetical protein
MLDWNAEDKRRKEKSTIAEDNN